MKIETKFNIGEIALILYNNTVTEATVDRISIDVKEETTQVFYSFKDNTTIGGFLSNYSEDIIFKTKKELLESL